MTRAPRHPVRRVGFTLIETAIAVTIVGILAAVAVGGLHAGRERAERAVLQSDITRVAEAQASYFGASGVFAPSLNALPGAALTDGTNFLGMVTDGANVFFAARRTRSEALCAVQLSHRARAGDAGAGQIRCAESVVAGAPLLVQMGNAYSFDVSGMLGALANAPGLGPTPAWAAAPVDYIVYAFGDGSGYLGRPSDATRVTHTYQGTPTARTVSIGFWLRDGRFLSAETSLPAVGDPSLSGTPIAAMTVAPGDTIPLDQEVEFSAGNSRDPDGRLISFAWSLEGGVRSGERLKYRFATAGTHTVTLTVTDNSNRAASVTRTMLVTGAGGTTATSPTAMWVASPLPPVAGQPVQLDASPSIDPSGRIATVTWQVSGNGAMLTSSSGGDAQGTTGTGLRASAMWTGTGTASVRAIVLSSSGLADTVSQSFTVLPLTQAPSLYITSSVSVTRVGAPVTFTASSNATGSGGTVAWSLGDGTVRGGLAVSHAYAIPGTYTVRATAATTAGGTTSGLTVVTVLPNMLPAPNFTTTPGGAVTPGDVVTFDASSSSDADGTIVLYRWLFSDGQYATGPVVTRNFPSGGTYTATLTVRDDARGERSSSQPITVNGTPVANFTHPAVLQAGVAHPYDATASIDPAGGTIFRYVWSWPDGTVDSSASPTILKALPGTVAPTAAVTLTVRSTSGMSGSQTISIPLNRAPVADFTWLPTPALEDSAVTFTSTSTDADGDALTYAWTFDGVGPVAGATPTHTFATGGVVTVAVTVTDGRGGSATKTESAFRVVARPTGAFSVAPDSMAVGVAAPFTVAATADAAAGATIARYLWTIDGVTDSTLAPSRSITLASSGTKTISVRVRDSFGQLSDVIATTVVVRAPLLPIAALSIGATARVGIGLAADGTGSTTDPLAGTSIAKYLWAWGDGRVDSTSGSSTSVTWAAPGTYVVSLTVRDALGQLSVPATASVVVTSGPSASFTVTPSPAIRGAANALSSTATSPQGYSLHHRWLVDGGVVGGDASSAAWTPAVKGPANVQLVVWDDFGGVDTSAVTIVTVVGTAPSAASLGVAPASVLRGATATLTAGATEPDGDAVTYAFDVFDGGSWTTLAGGAGSTTANGVSFSYTIVTNVLTVTPSTVGSFLARTRVTDVEGTATSASATVLVANAAPTCGAISAAPASFAYGSSTTLGAVCTDSDGDTPLTYAWTSTDGHSSTSATPAWTFATPGVKTISLTVTDALGAVAAAVTRTVTVTNGAPTCAAISLSPVAPNAGDVVNLGVLGCSDPEGGALSYSWTGPDGFTSTVAAPSHTWASATSGTVSVTVTDPFGASVVVDRALVVSIVNTAPTCDAAIAASPGTSVTEGDALTLSISCADPNGVSYDWAWADGGATTGTSTTRSATVPMTGWVTMTATDGLGATTVRSIFITVTAAATNNPPWVTITGPLAGATWYDGQEDTLVATIGDGEDALSPGTLASEFYLDGVLIAYGNSTIAPNGTTMWVVNAPNPMPLGGVTLVILARDAGGLVAADTMNIAWGPAPPPPPPPSCDVEAPVVAGPLTGYGYDYGGKRHVEITWTINPLGCRPDEFEMEYRSYLTADVWYAHGTLPYATSNTEDFTVSADIPVPGSIHYGSIRMRSIRAGSATSPSAWTVLYLPADVADLDIY